MIGFNKIDRDHIIIPVGATTLFFIMYLLLEAILAPFTIRGLGGLLEFLVPVFIGFLGSYLSFRRGGDAGELFISGVVPLLVVGLVMALVSILSSIMPMVFYGAEGSKLFQPALDVVGVLLNLLKLVVLGSFGVVITRTITIISKRG